jgi:hypothetical protein
MRISQRRVRIVENYLTGIADNAEFYVGLIGLEQFRDELLRIGFSQNLNVGEQVLPAVQRSVSRFNANGGYRIRRDLPMETLYREVVNRNWQGDLQVVFIPYRRYPREPILAPNVELLIRNGADNNPILVSHLLTKNDQNMGIIKHIINLFLELFGECEILQDNLLPAFNVPITRLNWDVFPQGNYPWVILAPRIQGIINVANQQRRSIIQRRIERISRFNPNFVAVGKAGFHGYMVFGFDGKNFFILESIYTGNATYILGQNWPQLSQYTKEQIITNNLQEQRIVHTQGWDTQIDNLLA